MIADALLVLKYMKNNSIFIVLCLIWLQRASPEFKKLQRFDLLIFSIRDKYNSRKKKCTSFFLCTHRKKLLKLGDYLANEMQILHISLVTFLRYEDCVLLEKTDN